LGSIQVGGNTGAEKKIGRPNKQKKSLFLGVNLWAFDLQFLAMVSSRPRFELAVELLFSVSSFFLFSPLFSYVPVRTFLSLVTHRISLRKRDEDSDNTSKFVAQIATKAFYYLF
jgi:hypothetical protein